MSNIGKSFSLILVVILAVSSLMMIESASAQTIPKPSVPEFTLKLADHSYDVPASTTSTTDPYTGKTTTHTSPAYHVQNLTIDIIFKNQPYPSTINGNSTTLYYDIAIKPHFTQDWYGPYDKGWFPAQINSEYTTISFPRSDYPDEGQVDFRVQVYLGYHYSYVDYSHIQAIPESSFASSASDWSNTQTITIPETSASTSPNPTPTPTMPNYGPTSAPTPTSTVPEFSSWTIPLLLTIMVALAGLLVYHKKQKTLELK